MPKGVFADPTLKARILEMAQAGVRPGMIQRQMPGVSIGYVYSVIAQARAAGVRLPTFPLGRLPPPEHPVHEARVAVRQPEHVARLEAAAERRGCAPSDLIRRVVETVLADDMVDAILDDGKGAA